MERVFRIVTSVGFSVINNVSTRGGANCDDLRLTARLPIIAALAIVMLIGVLPAIPLQSSAHAASAYLADEIGNTEITVTAGDDFQVVLYVVDITGVAGYECKITVSGPATPTGSAVHGDWFADGHTVFDGIYPVPADYHTAMLISPSYVSGSGAVVVFTLHADEEGSVAINVDSEYFLFAESDGDVIELDVPSTLYVTVGTGEGDSLQGEDPPPAEEGYSQVEEPESPLDDSKTWYVNDLTDPYEDGSEAHPFDTIQDAVDEASEGDTVLVMDGEYTGEGNRHILVEKPLTIMSQNLHGAVIDCSLPEPPAELPDEGGAFYLYGYDNVVIDGFTILNAQAFTSGGAIYCYWSHNLTISNNLIENCSAKSGGAIYCDACGIYTVFNNQIHECHASYSYGGGIYVPEGGPHEITHNVITNCSAHTAGGGIYIECGGFSTVSHNVFLNNSTGGDPWGGQGGGLYIYDTPRLTVEENEFTLNGSDQSSQGVSGEGGGLCVDGCQQVRIIGNIFDRNTAADNGGGMWLYELKSSEEVTAEVSGNTITGNEAGNMGGGAYIKAYLELFTSNSISNNVAAKGAGIACEATTDVEVSNNVICGNGVDEALECDQGGGVYITGNPPTFLRNTIAENCATNGGGI